MAIEHFVDCSTGQAVDRDYEGQLLPTPELVNLEERALKAKLRADALERLRSLAVTDEVVRDLLVVLEVQ
jgi:hypothetical protein